MANFTNNSDKYMDESLTDLYNSVLSKEFSNEGAEPVVLQQAKDWGKIEQDLEDDIINVLIKTARLMCESYSGIGFVSRDIILGINNADGNFTLPYGPVTSSPTATDIEGNTLSVTFNCGQITNPLGRMIISYTGGYETLPDDLVTALKAQFLFLYENRGESDLTLSPIAKMILAPIRKVV